MKRFRLIAASLALLLGASAATFAQPMGHDRGDDRDSHRGVVVDRDHGSRWVYGRDGDYYGYQVRRDNDDAWRYRTDRDDHDRDRDRDSRVRVRGFENGRGQARGHDGRGR